MEEIRKIRELIWDTWYLANRNSRKSKKKKNWEEIIQ